MQAHLMHQKAHETRRDNRIVEPDVPSHPLLLEPVEPGNIDVCVEAIRQRNRSIVCHDGGGENVRMVDNYYLKKPHHFS